MNVPAIEDLCNGSTPDSDSVCGGSNPSSSAKKKATPFGVAFLFARLGIRKGGTSPQTGVKKCPVDTFLARGRGLHCPPNKKDYSNEWSFLFLHQKTGSG